MLIFVDCEATGPCPGLGKLTEFAAITYTNRMVFHGIIYDTKPSFQNAAIPEIVKLHTPEEEVFQNFQNWIRLECGKLRPIMVSDNPAFDWQWINEAFHRLQGENPFGHSARRIGDFYAGLVNNFYAASDWKKLRVTHHSHNPVDDAMGNLEAYEKMLRGER